MVLEASIEKFLDTEVKSRGGFTVKLNPTNNKGIPDRLVVLPDRIFFAELKRPRGGVLARLQAWWMARISKLGHEVVKLKTREEVTTYLDSGGPPLY